MSVAWVGFNSLILCLQPNVLQHCLEMRCAAAAALLLLFWSMGSIWPGPGRAGKMDWLAVLFESCTDL